MMASEAGHSGVIEILIKHDAQVNTQDGVSFEQKRVHNILLMFSECYLFLLRLA